jgi:hypothetical protein
MMDEKDFGPEMHHEGVLKYHSGTRGALPSIDDVSVAELAEIMIKDATTDQSTLDFKSLECSQQELDDLLIAISQSLGVEDVRNVFFVVF